MYKNGQIITVDGKRYRVKTAENMPYVCAYCALQFSRTGACGSLCLSKENKLNIRQYLKKIPAKGKVLAK